MYYLPSFTKFEQNNLFLNNKNNLKYSICLDIEKIVIKYSQLEEVNEENNIKLKLNQNFLYKIHKKIDNKLREIYQNINKIHQ